jgi:hypothetical protein
MLDRSKGKGQTKYNPWSSRLRFGREVNDPTQETFAVTKPRRKPTPTQGCSDSEDEEF